MKAYTKWLAAAAMLCAGFCSSCSDFEPEGMPELTDVATAYDLATTIDLHDINFSWKLPAATDIEAVLVSVNGNNINPVTLGPDATSYTIKGGEMGKPTVCTVKIKYAGGRMSQGVSATATIPQENLRNVENAKMSVRGRKVTLDWELPDTIGYEAVRITLNGNHTDAMTLAPTATSVTLRSQPMDIDLQYDIQLVYDTYYASSGVVMETKIPFIKPTMAYLLTAPAPDALPDDDERAAAAWFAAQPDAEFVTPDQLADLDTDQYPVLWVEIDRVGLPMGWENLPAAFSSASTIAALKAYSAEGGNLFFANFATQLTVPLGFVPANMAPTVYGNGDGGSGDDVWVINPYLGWDFRNGSDQGFYDRTTHAIFNGIKLEDPNNYGYENLPLIGPGQREDHNCLWDCNIYGRGDQRDVIANFELTTNSMVLATWGHVRDHCVAGLVEFYSTADHGRCIAMGLAAYEWHQNSGENPYQHNIEQLTKNILDYLK